jgi:phosphoglycolate phosphatase
VGRVTRDAYVEAFRRVTGRPLVQLPQLPGRLESEIFFDALALNGADPGAERRSGAGGSGGSPSGEQSGGSLPRASMAASGAASEDLLVRFSHELASAFAARRDQLTEQGRLLPGAAQAVAEVGALHGVVQSVLTGTIRPNAVLKLRAFGLDRFFDTEVGGYGSQVYPKGALLLMTRTRAAEKYGTAFGEDATVYIADSTRDIEAARAGGARCLAVASGRSSVSELRAAGADAVFGDLTDTAAVVAAVDRLTLAAAG